LRHDEQPRRISLPTYPFAKEHYWLELETTEDSDRVLSNARYHGQLHPLLHENTSNISELSYRSMFTGDEFFFKDHVVKEHKILPGVAYLEMVNNAIHEAWDDFDDATQCIKIKNMVWIRPIFGDTL